jgi:hypothetical protein
VNMRQPIFVHPLSDAERKSLEEGLELSRGDGQALITPPQPPTTALFSRAGLVEIVHHDVESSVVRKVSHTSTQREPIPFPSGSV